jgi:ABC-type uncharacterized transport system involved in gliding motility auxiliary subunit
VAIQYAGETEAIPVVQQTRDLEYRMASALRALTRERLPVVGFLRGHGEQELLSNLRIVESQLREDYALQTIGLDSATASIPDTLDVVVIANPALPMSSTDADALEAYVARGGSLFLIAIARPAIDRLLRPYGIGLSQNLVFDLRSRANIQLRNESGGTYALPYPLWPMTIPASGHMIVRGVSTIIATWAGGIDVSQADTTRVIPLLGTSEAGGWLPLPAMINPDQDWTTLADNILPQLVAAALVPDEAGGDGRIVLVTSPELVLDDFLPGNPEALLFFQNAVDWLAQDEALISIRAKDRSPPRLLFPSAIHRDATKYGNMIGIPLLFVLLGVIRSGRRRGAQRRSYDEQAS